MELDRVPLWRSDHVTLRQLADDFAQYLYLPRLRDDTVLLSAVESGAGSLTWEQETFAYAERFDERAKRYEGLRHAPQTITPTLDGSSVIVRPEVARAQLDAAAVRRQATTTPYPTLTGGAGCHTIREGSVTVAVPTPLTPIAPAGPRPARFFGTVNLRADNVTREAATIAEAIVAHLNGLVDADVEISLEIHAALPGGAGEQLVRTVTENCRSLRFKDYGFEEV